MGGTTEQFPNTDANEGHFYMECSNKGICDRKSGKCDCFDGYTGTACPRAACPNDCSGHGTCESIKELAEMRSYDTNDHDVSTTRVAGSANHHGYDASIEESYSYNLWDQDKTMGCKCDPVYYGADCSLKKCKYGVDPLFYDHEGVIRQTTVVHVGSGGKSKGDLSGSFKIVFYDVFGEKYVTKSLNAKTASATDVKLALQALPNGVISSNNQDVTAEQPDAVYVSKQSTASGVHEKIGGIGGGDWENGLGVGLGTMGDHGSEFTITFKSNPGILKSIEIDTRGVNNPGNPDYWVANARQGQFASRHTTNLGRIQSLAYGSKILFTNTDLTTGANAIADDALVKVGGQEFRVDDAQSNRLILDEPYLGASILPVTVDTGVSVEGEDDDSTFVLTDTSPATTACSDKMKIIGEVTPAQALELQPGAEIVVRDCAMTVIEYTEAITGDTIGTAAGNANAKVTAGTFDTSSTNGLINVQTKSDGVNGHDCPKDLLKAAADANYPVLRRSDSTDNVNVYSTSGDIATKDAAIGVTVARGSASAFFTSAAVTSASPASQIFADVIDPATTAGQVVVTASDTIDPVFTACDNVFIHGYGPFQMDSVDATAKTITFGGVSNGDNACAGGTYGSAAAATARNDAQVELLNGFFHPAKIDTGAAIHLAREADGNPLSTVVPGSVLLIGGRRYRVRDRSVTGNPAAGTGTSFTLSETFAGGQLRQVCSECVSSIDAAEGLQTDRLLDNMPAGTMLLLGSKTNTDYAATVSRTVTESNSGGGATGKGVQVGVSPTRGSDLTMSGAAAGSFNPDEDLYMVHGFSAKGYSVSVITEAAAGTTYQYVAQCSNRGSCDASTGLCKCFKGYSNDNCDTQNMLAA